MNITVIGTGYVGLVSGACLAEVGNNVFCLDVDQSRIDLLNRGEIPIYESVKGQQTRSLCYVDDLVEAFIRFMDLPAGENGAPDFPGLSNLGNPREFTIRQMVEQVIALTGSKSKRFFRPLPDDDPKQRQPGITLAKEMLDWEPLMPLEEGLKKTITYFESVPKSGS